MKNYSEFFWEQLPQYYDESDTYKDADGKGLLRRFLSIFGAELQQEFFPKLDNLLNEVSPETASTEFLSEIAYQVGRPLDILEDLQVYRSLLTMIISIYKLKGTTESYKMFFGILGYSIVLTEYYPESNLYDNNLKFDEANVYDINDCEITCTEYSITYTPLPTKPQIPLTPQQIERVILSISLYLQPVNAKLANLIYAN